MEGEVAMLAGAPETYQAFAVEYFERDVPLTAVAHVLAGQPLHDVLLATFRSERTLDELAADIAEIGYGA